MQRRDERHLAGTRERRLCEALERAVDALRTQLEIRLLGEDVLEQRDDRGARARAATAARAASPRTRDVAIEPLEVAEQRHRARRSCASRSSARQRSPMNRPSAAR